MTNISTSGDSVSRALDVAGNSSYLAATALPVSDLSPIQLLTVWDELADLVKFGEAILPHMLAAKAYKWTVVPASSEVRHFPGLWAGSMTLGPIVCSNFQYSTTVKENAATTEPVGAAGGLLHGTALNAVIQDTDGVTVATIDTIAANVHLGFLMAAHHILENTTGFFEALYDQLQRSDVQLPDDFITMSRARSLFGGSTQKIIQSWSDSAHHYSWYIRSGNEIRDCQAIATVLVPQLLTAIAPVSYQAFRDSTSPLLEV